MLWEQLCPGLQYVEGLGETLLGQCAAGLVKAEGGGILKPTKVKRHGAAGTV